MNAYPHLSTSTWRPTQRGLSLIELMVSITIGLLILSTLVTLFVSQSRSRAELDKSNRMIDNGRYALELMADSLRITGFYGELDPTSVALPGSITNPCSTAIADMSGALKLHVVGYDAADATSIVASPPCSLSPSSLKAGSDILALRRADTSDPIAQSSAINGIHYIQVSSCRFDTITHLVDTNPGNLTLRPRDCTSSSTTPYTSVRRFVAQTYYISPNNIGSDGIPTLMRKELDPAGSGAFVTTPLVEGIEYMQIEYGIDDITLDTDGDGTVGLDGIPDSYSECSACTITDWSRVVSVKLYIVARNIESTGGHVDKKTYDLGQAGTVGPLDDAYKRHAYTLMVRLVNPSSRMETPTI